MQAVLDPNVVISGLLSPHGSPARVLRAWREGYFETIVSRALIDELERALAHPKLRRRIPSEDAVAALRWLEAGATLVADPLGEPHLRSEDPGDDYLIALAGSQAAALVSGDRHLLALAGQLPVFSPARFLEFIGRQE